MIGLSPTHRPKLSTTHPLPLYAQLAELLRRRILDGGWQQGNRIPSQGELAAEFGVARVTVRQAIAMLEEDGLLESRRGRGTFLLAQPRAGRRLAVQTTLRSLVEMLRGDEPQMLTLTEGVALPRLSERDGTPAPTYTFMRRIHLRDGVPYCVIAIYLDGRIFRRAPQRFRREVMIPILANLPGVTIARANQTLTIGAADAEIASHLGMSLGAPVAFVRRVFRAPDETVIYLGEVTYRGDLIELEMDLVP